MRTSPPSRRRPGRNRVRLRPLIRRGDRVAGRRGGPAGRGIAAYEAPFLNQDTPRPAVDPAGHIRELVSSGHRAEAVRFWMSEVVRLPDEVVAQMDGAPWVAALEPLARTLSYDLAVSAAGVPAAKLGKISAPVLIWAATTARAGSGAPSPNKPPQRQVPG